MNSQPVVIARWSVQSGRWVVLVLGFGGGRMPLVELAHATLDETCREAIADHALMLAAAEAATANGYPTRPVQVVIRRPRPVPAALTGTDDASGGTP